MASEKKKLRTSSASSPSSTSSTPPTSSQSKSPPELTREILDRITRFAHLGDLICDKSGSRTTIIHLLSLTPLTPGDISDIMGLSPSGVSQHLNKLASAGLVRGDRDAQRVVYSIHPDLKSEFQSLMREVLV